MPHPYQYAGIIKQLQAMFPHHPAKPIGPAHRRQIEITNSHHVHDAETHQESINNIDMNFDTEQYINVHLSICTGIGADILAFEHDTKSNIIIIMTEINLSLIHI